MLHTIWIQVEKASCSKTDFPKPTRPLSHRRQSLLPQANEKPAKSNSPEIEKISLSPFPRQQ